MTANILLYTTITEAYKLSSSYHRYIEIVDLVSQEIQITVRLCVYSLLVLPPPSWYRSHCVVLKYSTSSLVDT